MRPEQLQFPLELAARLTLKPGAGEELFNFRFDSLPAADPELTGETRLQPAGEATAKIIPSIEIEEQLRSEPPTELLRRILDCERQIALWIERQNWREIYRPALEAKDLALILERRGAPQLEPRARNGVNDVDEDGGAEDPAEAFHTAVRSIVRGAWLLEHHGDGGDGKGVRDAYGVFHSGVLELQGIIEAPARGE
jgi:hypothetical protein